MVTPNLKILAQMPRISAQDSYCSSAIALEMFLGKQQSSDLWKTTATNVGHG